ncbi:Gfo/Idh/MocA family protein [Arvimicrobium flavum]|uniref:Gfo/Idh/MocA family protein n=1 Tax=Arvimicrobium flavum TaxID=3393320 RepID=UPI00237A81E1|nr:Gfo/Idh/MocA family oxidoreductase [Mesorhizobium shangrilense]
MTKLAIVGLGLALAPHMQSLKDLKGRVSLGHAVTRSPERAATFNAEYAAEFGIEAASDLAAALADPELDGVILLTPPQSHLALGAQILAAGKHLLIEKPAGLTTDDSRALLAQAQAAGLLVAPVLQHRFRPAIRTLERRISAGEFGRLCGGNCLFPWWRAQSYYDTPGRGTYARDGGGVLLTQAIHTLDVLRALAGGIRIVASRAVTSALHRMEAEDMVAALAEFGPDAAPGTIFATTACYPGMSETITLIFERATVHIDAALGRISHHDGRVEVLGTEGASGNTADPMAFHHGPHRDLIENFVDALEGKAALSVGLSELVATREVIDQMPRPSAG